MADRSFPSATQIFRAAEVVELQRRRYKQSPCTVIALLYLHHNADGDQRKPFGEVEIDQFRDDGVKKKLRQNGATHI
ncbi:hypothetical protein FSP39_017366 [Pinctada imbricata]|uniref:Uncharacterized protein n=1 Tax=Pinctada imbricata TaxID=66713 RepID=A0AA89BQ25_PINIB|nr:hypothetical protein FSP39_017366 [Pinctada imbricata]